MIMSLKISTSIEDIKVQYGFGEYHGYGEIVRWLNEISQQYPSMARVLSIGTTAEGRNIVAIKVESYLSSNTTRGIIKLVIV